MKKNKIPTKNYIIIMVLFITVFGITFGISAWYRSYEKYSLGIPVIKGKISEIDLEQLNNYMIEHDNFFLYIGTSYNEICRKIEKKLPDLISNLNIKDQTIYLNVDDLPHKDVINILSKYGYNENEIYIPSFLIIKDGKILSASINNEILNISDIAQILDENEMVN